MKSLFTITSNLFNAGRWLVRTEEKQVSTVAVKAKKTAKFHPAEGKMIRSAEYSPKP
jgi:hypothetical protein